MTINLLPQKEKKELEKEKNWKKVFIILIFILIFILFLILIIFCLRTHLQSQIKPLKSALLERQEALANFQPQEFQQLAIRTNKNLSKIQKFWQEQIFIMPIFDKIASFIPDSIYFTGFSLQKIVQGDEKILDIYIKGWAEDREKLFYFKENLQKEKSFKDVYFSPSSWVEPSDIDFSLTFQFKINEF